MSYAGAGAAAFSSRLRDEELGGNRDGCYWLAG
jgi:hypothetical protein